MLDPSESRFSRIIRLSGLTLLFGAVMAYNADFDPGKLWTVLGGMAVPFIAYFAIRDFIVDPILTKLGELEYKIDRLSGKKTPYD